MGRAVVVQQPTRSDSSARWYPCRNSFTIPSKVCREELSRLSALHAWCNFEVQFYRRQRFPHLLQCSALSALSFCIAVLSGVELLLLCPGRGFCARSMFLAPGRFQAQQSRLAPLRALALCRREFVADRRVSCQD